jgi:hypothetical protein
MWTPCPVILDEPVKILGLEPEDVAVVGAVTLLASLGLDAIPSFACGLGLGAALYFAKRNRPPGALLHRLHALELTKLPGILGLRLQRYSPW